MSRSTGNTHTGWLEVYHAQMMAMREVAQAALDSFDRMERVMFRAANEALAEQTAIASSLPEAVDDEGTNTLLAHFQPSAEHLMKMQREVADELSASWSDFNARVTGTCGQYAQMLNHAMSGQAMTPWMSAAAAPIEAADGGAAVQPLSAMEDAFKQWQSYAQQAMQVAQHAFEQAQSAPPGVSVPMHAAPARAARAGQPAARKPARKSAHKSASRVARKKAP
jgi:hypothetical protein